jgi:hypothetical protein
VPAEVSGAHDASHLASIVDLSAGGARLRCKTQLENFQAISLVFSSNFSGSDNYVFLVDAEIVYLTTITENDSWEYGIRFVRNADDSDGAILSDTSKMLGNLCQQYQASA